MHRFVSSFLRDERGMAAEFALVLPLLLIFVLGTIDIGLYAWRINQAEKATQFGARWAAVNEPLANEIASTSYVNFPSGSGVVAQGDRLPQGVFATITCDSDGCVGGTLNPDAFGLLADRMRLVLPAIEDGDIEVIYSDSGLGYAGNPSGPDASPLITVRLVGMTFTPITLLLFDADVGLPDFSYTLTAEDLCSFDPDDPTQSCKT